jgi:TolB-like protein/DNA-binding winged helix-turn-helix (wHTH) protein/Flp pilus assembly protein TadD
LDGGFRVGSWLVEPSLNTISCNGTTIRLKPKVMEVLVCLAQHAGESLAKEQLLQDVWPGTFVTDDALKRCILELRRVFQDDAREPRVIQTIAKRRYRLVAPVEMINGIKHDPAEMTRAVSNSAVGARAKWWVGTVTLGLALLLILLTVLNVGGVRERLVGRSSLPAIHSLAVLPLQNLSADPAQEYFADGMTDALITDLAQIGSLKVISRTSSMQYRQTKKSLPEIAHELNVDGIIEGTVQRSGDRVRITAQLVHGPSDRHLWANSYERDTRDIFALERDLTEEIAQQVQAQLTVPKQTPLAQPRPLNYKALDAYLKGNYYVTRGESSGDDDEKRKSAEYFQQAIDADPDFVPAYIGLADAHCNLVRGSSEDIAIRRRAAERALELDPNSSDAWTILADIKEYDFDWSGAEREHRRAIALNTNNARAHDDFATFLGAIGRLDEGLREGEIAQELDPNEDHLSSILEMRGEHERAIEFLRRMVETHPDDAVNPYNLYRNYAEIGMPQEAIQELAQACTLLGWSEIAANLHHDFTVSGYQGAMREFAKELEHLQATDKLFVPENLAYAYLASGDKDRAFYWLEQAYKHREKVSHDNGLTMLKTDPLFDSLHSDPRFKDLLRRVGLPQ